MCGFIFEERGFPGGSVVKNPPANAGDQGSIPGSGGSLGERNGYPLQYSCLENPMDRGPQQATVHGVAKTWTRLSHFTFTFTLNPRMGSYSEMSSLQM